MRYLINTLLLVCSVVYSLACSAVANNKDLEVMTFNIRYGHAQDGDNAWQFRRDDVIEMVKLSDPDLLAMQESVDFQHQYIMHALPEYAMTGVGRDDGGDSGEFSPILYKRTRFEVIEEGTFWFSTQPTVAGSMDWGNRYPRICSWAYFKDNTQNSYFYLYNMHWDHESQIAREKSAELLMAKIRQRSHKDSPVIVTGDFNARPTNPAFLALLSDDKISLTNTISPQFQPDYGTFHGFSGVREGNRIDAILVSKKVSVEDSAIVYFNANKRFPSDHFPVRATLTFK